MFVASKFAGFRSACPHAAVPSRWLRAGTLGLLVGGVMALGACATASVAAPTVVRLTSVTYPATQVVDVLDSAPQVPFTRIARLRVDDPTGTATPSQLRAELVTAAQKLGANALVLGQVVRGGAGAGVAFNPAGGQQQEQAATGSISLTAIAIRYTR